ncbi:MAG: Zn(2+)-responsive transcriptional regulator [Alteromonadaceae bacterium]|nr:Zn(2+)-responsive transcriptional regulator [Alteromonadaceae bacterium]
MKIGQLVERFGVSVDTIRFYEKKGLLQPSARSNAGYRLYSEADSERLDFILRSKSMGFSLGQIKELLQIEDNRARWRCEDVKDKVQQKMTDIEQQIKQLKVFYNSLEKLSDACCGGPRSATECSILDSLETGDYIQHENHNKEQ